MNRTLKIRKKESLIAIPESDRKKLAKQVRAFYDVSSMGGGFGNRCSDCKSLLEASGGSSFSFFTQNELQEALRSNWYMRDENAEHMREAIRNLERCGVSTLSFSGIADKLAWYVGGDGYKIRQLQQKLNELGVTDHLTEDGVYGKKTHNAWLGFLDKLEHGTVPVLAWTDWLQTEKTGIIIGGTKSAQKRGLSNALMNGMTPYVRIDPPRNGQGYHINVDDKYLGQSEIYDWLQKELNHYPLRVYLKNPNAPGQRVFSRCVRVIFSCNTSVFLRKNVLLRAKIPRCRSHREFSDTP